MRTIDRIRNYLQEQKNAGMLTAGDRLPSYHELMKIGQGSYATVMTAMKHLQSEGLLEIRNGAGSFLSGGNMLRICILHNPQVLSEQQLAGLLTPHLKKISPNISLHFYSSAHLKRPEVFQQFIRNEQAAVVIHTPQHPSPLPMANLSDFEGYERVTAEQKEKGDVFRLPFISMTRQFAKNRMLIRRAGFDPERIDSSFSWWIPYVEACRKQGVCPASMMWDFDSYANASQCCGLLLALFGFDRKIRRDGIPFRSEEGRCFLRLLRDHQFYAPENRINSFFNNGAGVSFSTGSWIVTQNRNPNRPDIHTNPLEVIPIHHEGQTVKLMARSYLSAYIGNELSVEERNRVWALMSLMSGREFQLDYCNASGMISGRSDIRKRDYSWNKNGVWDVFFPGKKDLIVFEDELFDREELAVMNMLLEDLLFYGADPETILMRMDQKTNLAFHAFDPHTGILNHAEKQ